MSIEHEEVIQNLIDWRQSLQTIHNRISSEYMQAVPISVTFGASQSISLPDVPWNSLLINLAGQHVPHDAFTPGELSLSYGATNNNTPDLILRVTKNPYVEYVGNRYDQIITVQSTHRGADYNDDNAVYGVLYFMRLSLKHRCPFKFIGSS